MTALPQSPPPRAAPHRAAASLPGLFLTTALLVTFYLGVGQLSPDIGEVVQQTFALSVSAGVAMAIVLIPTRRQLLVLLAAMAVATALVRLTRDSPAVALAVALGSIPAVLVFRLAFDALAVRWSPGLPPMGSRRSLLALFAAGALAVPVNLLASGALTVLGVEVGWITGDTFPLPTLALARLIAHLVGLVTVTPLVLLLFYHPVTTWSRRVWAEIGGWLLTLLVVAVLGVVVRAAYLLAPLLLLGAFTGLVLAVLRRGYLAAAVLSPACAVTAALVMLEPAVRPHADMVRVLGPVALLLPAQVPGMVAGLMVGLLAWAAAAVVAERDEGRRLAVSEAAAQQALTAVQAALLPSRVTSQRGVTIASRYRGAGSFDHIGGDWYDTVPLPAGGLGLVIGDVEGHDLTAASVMGLVRGAVRSFALEGHPPSVLLERVGAFLASAGTDRLVTMAYVHLHPGDRTATMALAGHPPPLVVPASGDGAVQELEQARGPVLGLEGLGGWVERTVLLPRGASLVLYTDGLVDAPAAIRAHRCSPAQQLDGVARDDVDAIADRLIHGAPAYDDAAVLVARLTCDDTTFAQRTLPARPSSAGIARTWLRDTLAIWRAGGAVPVDSDPELVDVGELVVTELMSNAVRHSDRWVTVRLAVEGGFLRVEVEDTSERMPVVRAPADDVDEGRGLRLVEALVARWGVELVERGKVVWCELRIAPRSIVLPEAVARPETLRPA